MKALNLIPIGIILIIIFTIGKSVLPGGHIHQSNIALQELHSKNYLSLQKMKGELVELKKIEYPTKHNIWHIEHLEKQIAHISRYVNPNLIKPNSFLLKNLQHFCPVIVLIVIFLIYIWHQFRNKEVSASQPGLNNKPNRVHPGNDPVAEITHWQSMASGASNFKMQEFITTDTGIKVRVSFEVRLFCWAFILVGLIPALMEYAISWQDLDSIISPLVSFYGVFILIGVILRWIFIKNEIEFNQSARIIITSDKQYSFSNVYALQVISSIAGGHGNGIFRNNELNLILKNGNRINILNHGGKTAFYKQEEQLSKLLNVPVWQA